MNPALKIPSDLWALLHQHVLLDDWNGLRETWIKELPQLEHLAGIFCCPIEVTGNTVLPSPVAFGERGMLIAPLQTQAVLILSKESIVDALHGRDHRYAFDYTVMLDTCTVSHLEAWFRGVRLPPLQSEVASAARNLIRVGWNFDWIPYIVENSTELDRPQVRSKLMALAQFREHWRAGTVLGDTLPPILSESEASLSAEKMLAEYRSPERQKYFSSHRRQQLLAHVHLLYAALVGRTATDQESATRRLAKFVKRMHREFPVFGKFEMLAAQQYLTNPQLAFFAPLNCQTKDVDCSLRRVKGAAWDLTHFRNLFRFAGARLQRERVIIFTYLLTFDPKLAEFLRSLQAKGLVLNTRSPGYEAIFSNDSITGESDPEAASELHSLFLPAAVRDRKCRTPADAELDEFMRERIAMLEDEHRRLQA